MRTVAATSGYLFGAGLVVSFLLLTGLSGPAATKNSIVAGPLIIALGVLRGRRNDVHYRGWDRFAY